MRRPSTIPSLAPSIDDPIELLLACHGKVRHFADLALRLHEHVQKAPDEVDEQARQAATAILRYFTIAAPLHHQDEEEDLFPALCSSVSNAGLHEAIASLHAEHEVLNEAWQRLTPWLEALAQGQPPTRLSPARDEVAEFARRQTAHAQCEETQVYPFAVHLNEAQKKMLASAMVKRRTPN